MSKLWWQICLFILLGTGAIAVTSTPTNLVESREAIKPRPSQLEPCVRLSPHTAPDILGG